MSEDNTNPAGVAVSSTPPVPGEKAGPAVPFRTSTCLAPATYPVLWAVTTTSSDCAGGQSMASQSIEEPVPMTEPSARVQAYEMPLLTAGLQVPAVTLNRVTPPVSTLAVITGFLVSFGAGRKP